jgi:hypothetical protein
VSKTGGRKLTKRLGVLRTVALLCGIATGAASATSHVFIRNEEGVWLGSDSLIGHNDGSGKTVFSSVCKVSVVKNRLIFSAGFFKSIPLIKSQEDALPLESIDATVDKLFQLMATNHMDVTTDPKYNLNMLVVNVGVIQVSNGEFSGKMLGQTDALNGQIISINEFKFGVPHGYGDAISRENHAAITDPALADKIVSNPKAEILRLLQEEAIMRPEAVKGPFTVLLLRNDGTVSDFSDQPMCTIPPEAAYIPPKRSSTQPSTTKSQK